ncbi:MAG: hypothetical protein AMXMBFR23_05200 [Chloroflexota bacterium]
MHATEDHRDEARRPARWPLLLGLIALGVVASLLIRARRRASLGAPSFARAFRVQAPVEAVAAFHEGPDALAQLQPPLSGTRFVRVDPLGEGSVTEFLMGPGPFAIRWRAVHRDVRPGLGFTDEQVAGPMRQWVHRHEYRPLTPAATEVSDRIWFRHHEGARGLITRLMFNTFTLGVLFRYRAFATRRAVEARGAGIEV